MADAPGTPDTGALSVPRAHVVLWGALGGGLIGLLVLFGDLPVWDEADRSRAEDDTFGLWAAAIAAQTMVWVLAFPAIREISRRRRTPEAAGSREVVWATAALALVGLVVAVLPPLTGELPDTIPNRGLKTFILNVVAFALAIYAARAMWFAVAELRALGSSRAAGLDALLLHRRLRGELQLLLRVLGALVTLAVIASAALRAFTASVDPDGALPAQAVVLYGVTLSLVLALIYVPAHQTMLASGGALRERIAPLLPPGDPGFEGRLGLRDRIDSFLGLDVAATVSLRAAIAILSPLLGSLVSLVPDLG